MSDTEDRPRYPIEERNAALADVKFGQRIIEVIAVPWEEEAIVEYRGGVWREVFTRGAFDDLKHVRPGRVRANRQHDPMKVCGRMEKAHPSHELGLVTELRMSNTELGDETLQLAADGCLSASVGFAAGGAGQSLLNGIRRIKKAFLDHIAFVQSPAYQGAEVLTVRNSDGPPQHLPTLLPTPGRDEWTLYLEARRNRVLS